jgi:hypothetical protein
MTLAEEQWLYLLAESSCDIPLPPKPRNDVLNSSVGGPVMAPRMTYTATLEPDPVAGASDSDLYSFSFTTSAFATFAHHVHSFNGRLWDSDQSLDAPLPALTAAERSIMNAAAQAGDFNALLTVFKVSPRALPETLEVTLVHDAAQRWGLLVESPKPLLASRVSASVVQTGDISLEARYEAPVRLRDAAFADRSGTAYNSEWVELIVTEPAEISGVRLEHLETPTDTDSFVALTTLTGSGRFEPGDLIRMHAGIEPSTGAPKDGRVHLYRTSAGGTPSWMLHAGYDVCKLVDSGGLEVGRQEFRTGFSPLAATWVWNSDRTRAFAFPAAALGGASTPLPDGTYRIQWRFERDVSASGGTEPVLRQQGLTAAEVAVTQFSIS